MTPAKIAYLHLIRQPFSSAVILFGIVLAVATSGLLLRLHNLASERFASLIHTGDAIVGAKSGSTDLLLGMLNFEGDYPEFIPVNLYNTLRHQETLQFEDKSSADSRFVRAVFPFLLFAKVESFRVYATSPEFFSFQESGLPVIELGRRPVGSGEVIVGAALARKLALKEGDSFYSAFWLGTSPSAVAAQKLKVVGIWSETHHAWDRVALSTWDTAEKVLNEQSALLRTPWGTKIMHFMLIYLNDNGIAPLQTLINQRTVAQGISVPFGFQKLEELTGAGRELGLLVAVIILILSFTSVAAMMMGRFESMNVQLAVLRALGYSKSDLSLVLFYEALFLALLACLLGAVLDALIFPWIRDLLGANVLSADILPMSIWRSWPVWAAVVGGHFLSVLYPIWRISKQNIHRSLRSL